jgi:hypothetical protein
MDNKQVQSTGKRKPPAAGMGRKVGSTNKATKELKTMILEALGNAGGVEYLERKANDPKTASAFLSLIGKVLPMTIQGPGPGGGHKMTIEVEFVRKAP